jgi:hypothetical protein
MTPMIQYDAGRPRGCGRRSSALLSLEGHDSRTVLSIITVTGGAGLLADCETVEE